MAARVQSDLEDQPHRTSRTRAHARQGAHTAAGSSSPNNSVTVIIKHLLDRELAPTQHDILPVPSSVSSPIQITACLQRLRRDSSRSRFRGPCDRSAIYATDDCRVMKRDRTQHTMRQFGKLGASSNSARPIREQTTCHRSCSAAFASDTTLAQCSPLRSPHVFTSVSVNPVSLCRS